ncbi:MAG: creatininase family protein [Caldilineaceae bacterium]
MTTDKQPLILADLSWPEVAAIRDEVDVVLIPVGSNEQHGPNLALKMDIVGATQFCNHASALAYPKLLVAPSMPWGVSYHHMNFPGTITLSADTFIQTLVEVVDSLMQHGFDRYMIINGHGGNTAPLGQALVRINEALAPTFVGSALYFSFADSDINARFGITGITGPCL